MCEEGIHYGGYLEENTKFLACIFQAGLRLFHLTVQVILQIGKTRWMHGRTNAEAQGERHSRALAWWRGGI